MTMIYEGPSLQRLAYKGVGVCSLCEASLNGKVILFDHIDNEKWCDHDCRADWYELQGKEPPRED
jgi:hypothetical protein